MHKFFTEPENINGSSAVILGDDVKHIYKVLRLAEGEKVILNNCSGREYLAEISEINKKEVSLSIIEELEINNESAVEITLFQGLPKGQKMDLIVQKGTELGIKEFVPTIMERVDIKLKESFKKLDRLNRIALEASKQSKRSIIPEVKEPEEFENALNLMREADLIIVPYENAQNFGIKSLVHDLKEKGTDFENIRKIAVVIGPEGGFEESEIEKLKENNAYIVTLGKRILRTETAGFTAAALLQYEFGDLGGDIIWME